MISGIIFVIRHGLQWNDAPSGYGPHKTLYNRFVRWSRLGVFARIFAALAASGGVPERLMVDSTHLRRTARQRACCDGQGRLVVLLLTEGQMSDHKGARLLLPVLPPARERLADRGHDSDRSRAELNGRGIEACIPPMPHRKAQLAYDRALYRQRHRIENAFARLKNWRRVVTRYDRCAHTFFPAICIAATVTFWLQ